MWAWAQPQGGARGWEAKVAGTGGGLRLMVAMVGARSGSPNDDPATLPYRNVLHELLVALLGRSGEVFVEEAPGHRGPEGGEAAGGVANPGRCGLRLAEDISWVEGPDRAVLDEVVTLGFHFRELDAWARRERDPGVGPRELKSVQGSAYRRAMAAGVEEVLEVYSSAVLRLEQQLLAPGPGRPALALLQRFAAEFRPILGPLHHLVHRAMADNTRGKQLISELHKRAGCGVPALAACIERLLWHANQVLFRQLSAWMVHGLLQDHHGEFFIQRLDDAEEEGLGDEDRPKPEVEKIQATSDDSRLDPDHTLLVEWHRGFQVRPGASAGAAAADVMRADAALLSPSPRTCLASPSRHCSSAPLPDFLGGPFLVWLLPTPTVPVSLRVELRMRIHGKVPPLPAGLDGPYACRDKHTCGCRHSLHWEGCPRAPQARRGFPAPRTASCRGHACSH